MKKLVYGSALALALLTGLPGLASAQEPNCPAPERRFTDVEHRGGPQSFDYECSSTDGCFKRCNLRDAAEGRYVSDARLSERLSAAKCEEGVDWGWSMGTVWVDHGCEAVFRVYTH